MFHYPIREQNIILEIGENLPIRQMGVPCRYGQVVANLLANAIDALARVQTRKKQITITQTVQGANVVLTITDTGTGIKAAHLSKIFDPFFTTKKHHGSGMGLAHVHSIVTQEMKG